MIAEPLPTTWSEPPWNAALDVEAVIRDVPEGAQITGMFLGAVLDAAKARGVKLPSARDRYVAFRTYPLVEHCRVLVEAARALFPRETLRYGLRKLGRGSPQTLAGSTVGRVVLAAAASPREIVHAMAKSYPLHTRPAHAEVVDVGPKELVVRMRDIHYFLDSHHVGVFEGVLRFAKLEGVVTIHAYDAANADLRLVFR